MNPLTKASGFLGVATAVEPKLYIHLLFENSSFGFNISIFCCLTKNVKYIKTCNKDYRIVKIIIVLNRY